MQIPIHELISTGDSIRCATNSNIGDLCYMLRLLSFAKIRDVDIDQYANEYDVIPAEGILWLLNIDVVNLGMNAFHAVHLRDHFVLFDQDGFLFETVQSNYMICSSSSLYAKSTGLDLFTRISNESLLPPNLKVSGAVAYLLPDDDRAEYFFSVREEGKKWY